jgi:hypothetical protein
VVIGEGSPRSSFAARESGSGTSRNRGLPRTAAVYGFKAASDKPCQVCWRQAARHAVPSRARRGAGRRPSTRPALSRTAHRPRDNGSRSRHVQRLSATERRSKFDFKTWGARRTPDNLGYYGFNETLNAYYEVISYNNLLSDVAKRNRILF